MRLCKMAKFMHKSEYIRCGGQIVGGKSCESGFRQMQMYNFRTCASKIEYKDKINQHRFTSIYFNRY